MSEFLWFLFRPTILLKREKETLIQVFFCEYCKIFKSRYFEEHLQTAAFVFQQLQ